MSGGDDDLAVEERGTGPGGPPETGGSGADPCEHSDRAAEAEDHLAGLDDGCGCAEIWEHLSERRADD